VNLDTINVATILVVIFAVVGGVVCITNPGTLNFKDYLIALSPFVGGLAVGRGIAAHGRS
jgi:hypothetical protein